MTSDDWTWTFTPRATDQFADLDTHVQDRIVSKLDKLRVGQYRLACVLDHDDQGDHPSLYQAAVLESGIVATQTLKYIVSDTRVWSVGRKPVPTVDIASTTT